MVGVDGDDGVGSSPLQARAGSVSVSNRSVRTAIFLKRYL
jgi:hypothetical protein